MTTASPTLPITETDEWRHLPENRSADIHRSLVMRVARSQAWDLVLQVRVAEMIAQEISPDDAERLVSDFIDQLTAFTSMVDRFDQWIPAGPISAPAPNAAPAAAAAAAAPPPDADSGTPDTPDLSSIDPQEVREAADRVRTQRLVILRDRDRLGFPDDDPESAAIRHEINALTALVGDAIPEQTHRDDQE